MRQPLGSPRPDNRGARHPTRHRHPEPCIRAAASRQRQSPEQTTVLPAPDHPHPTSGLRTSATWKQHILVLRPIVLRHFGGLSNTSREDTTIMKTSYTQKRTPNKQIFPECSRCMPSTVPGRSEIFFWAKSSSVQDGSSCDMLSTNADSLCNQKGCRRYFNLAFYSPLSCQATTRTKASVFLYDIVTCGLLYGEVLRLVSASSSAGDGSAVDSRDNTYTYYSC